MFFGHLDFIHNLLIVLVFYLCITNYHKFNSSKQDPLIISWFCGSELQGGFDWALYLVSNKAGMKVCARLGSQLKALGKNSLPSSYMLAEFASLGLQDGCKMEVSVPLLTVNQGCSQLLKATLQPLHVVPSIFKASRHSSNPSHVLTLCFLLPALLKGSCDQVRSTQIISVC